VSLPKTIGDAAHMLLTAESPRKAFVLISESTASNLTGMYKGPMTPCQIKDPLHKNPCFYQRALQNAVENMERANITLYAFDPRGAVADLDIPLECAPGKPGPGADRCVGQIGHPDQNWIRYAQQGLTLTAEAAGGFAVTNSDDFDGGINRLMEEIDHYYLLGFSPTDPSGHGFRPVTVTTTRPGVILRYRRGYVMGPVDTPHESADPLAAMSSGILPRTDLPLRLSATAMSAAADVPKRKSATRLLAILEATLPQADVPELRYGLLAANLDTGKVESDVTDTVKVPSGPSSSAPAGTGVRVEIPIELTLPPGRYQLRASAMSSTVEKGGSVYLITDVPDFASGTLILGSPILGLTPRETVVLVRGPSAAQLPFTPTLDRTFGRTDILRIFCPVAHRPGAALQVTLSMLMDNDHVALSATPEIDAAANRPIEADVPLANLAPGAYRLRIRATDNGQAAQRELPIVIK
jgi:hypothetical protein